MVKKQKSQNENLTYLINEKRMPGGILFREQLSNQASLSA